MPGHAQWRCDRCGKVYSLKSADQMTEAADSHQIKNKKGKVVGCKK